MRFGQAVSTFLFHRVLGSQYNKRLFHFIFLPIDGDLALFHHLEQSRLGFGRRTVYFIDQDNVAEQGLLFVKFKINRFGIENRSTEHIRRHQVGCELDARILSINSLGN